MATSHHHSAAILPPEVKTLYTQIIDGILAASDLNIVSAKGIRRALQLAVNYDIKPQKKLITNLILERYDKFNHHTIENPLIEPETQSVMPASDDAPNGSESPMKVPAQTAPASMPRFSTSDKHQGASDDLSDVVDTPNQTNSPAIIPTQHVPSSTHQPIISIKRQSDSDDMSDVVDAPPRKKKVKQEARDDDAILAARLQAEENGRARPTRGGQKQRQRMAVVRTTPKKKKKMSAAKVKAEDDSDLDSGTGEEKRVNRSGAFHKRLMLSEPLGELLGGETTLSRPQTVKKIWEYVKERNLQNPNDKRQIRCDDAMRAVFKQDSVHMFTMNKLLSKHFYDPNE